MGAMNGTHLSERAARMAVVALLALTLCGAGIAAQAAQASGRSAVPKIRIVTTIYPVFEFARSIAGDRGEASLLLPPGAEVHTWQPRAGDVLRLASCDLFIYVGLHLEPWVGDLLRGLNRPRLRALEVGRDLESEEIAPGSGSGAEDPHVWLDFGLDLRIADRIRDALAGIDPAGTALFETNAEALKARLRDLDRLYRDGLARCRQRTVILAGHAAFGRLLARYGFEQVALYGFSPDAEPTPARIAEIVRLAKSKGIRVVFTEVGEPAKLAAALCREIGARTLPLNSCHNPPAESLGPGHGFFEIMKENLESLIDGCQGR
jgi:zinc transport system substrate-binding protein